jgi:putative flippase GtrA
MDKYREAISYIICGVLTVVINTGIFMILTYMNLGLIVANTIAFVAAVIFAYWSNYRYVFRVKSTKDKFFKFMGMRIGTLVIDNIGMIVFYNMGIIDIVAKILVNVIIVILNYVLSKLVIFKN